MKDLGYWPKDTKLLSTIYQGIKESNILLLQTHLWDYEGEYEREVRGQEIIIAAWEALRSETTKGK